jgi:hypothetical protein
MARFFLRSRSGGPESYDETWPVGREVVERLALPGITARDLLLKCRQLYDDCSRPGAEPPREGETPPAGAAPGRPVDREEAFARIFQSACDAELARPSDEIDDGVYGDGLLRVFDLAGALPGRAARGQERDVDLTVASGGSRVLVSVCNARHMTSLAARFRRLRDAGIPPGARRALLRDQRLSISPAAPRTREYLRALQDAGASFVRPSAECYAALAAMRRLLAEAAAGDLVVDGETVTHNAVKTWLSSHVPAAVRDLVDDIAEAPVDERDDTLDRLRDLLRGSWIVTLEDAARRSDLTQDTVWLLARRHADVFGTLAGPPPVVFLMPGATD